MKEKILELIGKIEKHERKNIGCLYDYMLYRVLGKIKKNNKDTDDKLLNNITLKNVVILSTNILRKSIAC